jgi:hypothetical protein
VNHTSLIQGIPNDSVTEKNALGKRRACIDSRDEKPRHGECDLLKKGPPSRIALHGTTLVYHAASYAIHRAISMPEQVSWGFNSLTGHRIQARKIFRRRMQQGRVARANKIQNYYLYSDG